MYIFKNLSTTFCNQLLPVEKAAKKLKKKQAKDE